MDDLISRQAVLNATSTTLKITGKENAETVYEYIKKLCDDIKALPSAQQWIPCSERLPNYDEEVLVDYHGKVRLASLTKNDEEYPWYFIVNRFNAKLETVRAWMPLPEPYEEETDG